MGGTDNIENPGPYLHRSSKKAPHLGILTTPAGFKLPASGVPLPTLPVEDRPMSREETVQAYAARLDALSAMGMSGPGADPPEDEASEAAAGPAEAREALPAPAPEVLPDPDADEAVLVEVAVGADAEAAAGEEKESALAFIPSRTGPFQTISVPLYPKGKEKEGVTEEPSIRTPRWRGG